MSLKKFQLLTQCQHLGKCKIEEEKILNVNLKKKKIAIQERAGGEESLSHEKFQLLTKLCRQRRATKDREQQ